MDARQDARTSQPPPGFTQGSGNGLEDRLRGMILHNDRPGPDPGQGQGFSQGFSQAFGHVPEQHETHFPPLTHGHQRPDAAMPSPVSQANRGFDGQAQQKGLTFIPPDAAPAKPSPASPKASRKRPNQAQRRQMNVELSIPFDSRAPGSWTGRPSAHHGALGNLDSGPRHRNHHTHDHGRQGPTPQASGPWIQRPHPNQQVSAHGYGGPRSGHQPGRGNPVHGPAPGFQHDMAMPRSSSHHSGALYNPQNSYARPEDIAAQSAYLEGLCATLVAGAEIKRSEIAEKESFRLRIEGICRQVIAEYEQTRNGREDFAPQSVTLKCFGSLASGFATKASDMDLGLISPLSNPQPDAANSEIPRLIEKAFLDNGIGARLLTRTRVPIIKVCESAPEPLMRDLLEQRDKWEKGIDVDHVAGADADDAADEFASHDKESSTDTQGYAQATTSHSIPSAAETGISPTEDKLPPVKLRQLENQPLSAYLGTAKRLLRKLNGRDLTMSNAHDFTREDFQTLLSVCKAFIEGLHNQALKVRLQSYPSLSFSPGPEIFGERSLLGLATQVEGEKIVMLWEDRATHERVPEKENQAERAVWSWKNIMNEEHYYADAVHYAKQLHTQLDRIKKLVSVQLLTLEQGQFEAANVYQERVFKIASGLRPAKSLDSDDLQRLVVKHYVSGIWSHEIRDQVREFVGGCPAAEAPSVLLSAVARRHKTLQLADELEKALDKQLYDTSFEGPIREYMATLRGPLVRQEQQRASQTVSYIVPPPADPSILATIRTLPDPSKLAPNQPRDRYHDKLEFPKTGIGAQCDINFSAHLALQNTLLLRCYSHADPRVRPLVLFVKHWAKMRGINTPYRGTLSSYGYVLMVLHFLVNVAQPFVCPNLQALGPQPPTPVDAASMLEGPGGGAGGDAGSGTGFAHGFGPGSQSADDSVSCRGHFVGFWRDEPEIRRLAAADQLTHNRDTIGLLLRGFFEYYAQNGVLTTYPNSGVRRGGIRGFDWGRDVLSIRTQGGLLSKQAKGWTGAKTVIEYRDGSRQSQGQLLSSPLSAEAPTSSTPFAGMGTGAGIQEPAASPQVTTSTTNSTYTIPTTAAPVPAPVPEFKEIRHRYLFSIEDPFELDHNVARTVTHNGIVAVRDEFRRAWRIIKGATAAGQQQQQAAPTEDLLEDANAIQEENDSGRFRELLNDLHGIGGAGQ